MAASMRKKRPSTDEALANSVIAKTTHFKDHERITVYIHPKKRPVRTKVGRIDVQFKKYYAQGTEIIVDCMTIHNEHLDWLLKNIRDGLFDANLIARLFQTSKDQTESVSAIRHLDKFITESPANIIVVADGTCPQTAALFAMKYKHCRVYSVDPVMRDEWVDSSPFPNLFCAKETIEEWIAKAPVLEDPTFVVEVHSHAHFYMDSLLSKIAINCNVVVFSMPCCFVADIDLPLASEITDWGVHSEKRICRIFTRKGSL